MPASLATAQAESLDRLLRIVRESPNDREARLAAAVILRMKSDEPTAAAPVATPAAELPPPRPTAPPKRAPLSQDELRQLAERLPHVPPARFITKHTPDYWRAILADWQRPGTARGSGNTGPPPRSKQAAA